MGVHIIAELYNLERNKIERVELVEDILDKVVMLSKVNCLGKLSHQFKPHGVSAIYLLAESHLSIHTWPEHGYAALDIFTCGEDKKAESIFNMIIKELRPKKYYKKVLRRANYEKGRAGYSHELGRIQEVFLGTS